MLKKLEIQNYAIIDEIVIDFSKGMNIITGETGAGKSILMGALSLILGDRADSNVLLNREKKCYVEGSFQVNNRKQIKKSLHDFDLDTDDELVIRREIAVNGKSRAFINDTPVNLEQLRTISSMLVDLHRQFDTLQLGTSDFQREVMDALAGNGDRLSKYAQTFYQYKKGLSQLGELKLKKDQFNKEYDYNRFLFDELEEAGFAENELEDAEAELKLLSNAEGIKTFLNKLSFELNEGEQPIVQQLKSLSNQIQPFINYHTALQDIATRLTSVHIELKDIAGEVDHVSDQVVYDPKKIEQLNNSINIGYKLFKKHGVKTTAELLQIKEELENKLQAVLNIDEEINALEKQLETLLEECKTKATAISEARKKKVSPLESQVNHLLHQVGMPNARIKVEIKDTELNDTGSDSIEFLFDANKSNRFEPIRKVASGGELSRLMLCIKSLVAESVDLATLIFDEIDTGISGEAAKQVGMIMKGLSGKRQLIAITHQPQIAGKADAHFFVYKDIRGEAIKTGIRELNNDERITALARMLSGEKPTAAAMENAREMMN
jgi:DNA repair protein RecN (Recombination protein N)